MNAPPNVREYFQLSPEDCHEGHEEDGGGAVDHGEAEDQDEEGQAPGLAGHGHHLAPELGQEESGGRPHGQQQADAQLVRHPTPGRPLQQGVADRPKVGHLF